MMRAMRMAVLMVPFVVGVACAQTTTWWNTAYASNSMLNKEQATTWLANNGDNMTKIVMQMYGIPADKQSTINKVIDAVIKYNNALNSNKELYNEAKVTPITDRNKIYEGKTYFVPDPRSIDRIMKGEDPATVLTDSMANAQNAQQARGEATSVPLHAMGAIESGASDEDAPAAAVTPTAGTTTANGATPVAPILGGWNAQNGGAGAGQAAPGDYQMLGVVPEANGAKRADGATGVPDTAVQRNQRGNITLMCAWDFVTAEPATKRDGALKGSADTGVKVGESN